jgi:NAD(P)-dependent dehydrogenase (short-subunit alcohol dehydrogenase family)
VLVTGASSGIGREAALYYAKAGASVTIVARNVEGLEETSSEIMKAAGTSACVHMVRADVRIPDDAKNAIEETIKKFGGLDILVANAGMGSTTTLCRCLLTVQYFRCSRYLAIGEIDPLAWWSLFEVNILGVFNFVR